MDLENETDTEEFDSVTKRMTWTPHHHLSKMSQTQKDKQHTFSLMRMRGFHIHKVYVFKNIHSGAGRMSQ